MREEYPEILSYLKKIGRVSIEEASPEIYRTYYADEVKVSSSEKIGIVSIEKASPGIDPKEVKVSGEEARKSFNTLVAARLAISLWIILGIVVLSNLGATIYLSLHLVNQPIDSSSKTPTQDIEKQRVESAVSMVNDTAKTLYSFLGTLVTGVTGYYFTTIERSSSSDEKK